jgi:eight-cysteine-cluster-containing protein
MQRLPILLALFVVLAVLACGNKQPAPPPVDPSPPPAEPTEPTEPTEPAPAAPDTDQSACAPTGCSGIVCAPVGDEVITTCEYRPEYDCYKQATCERQPGGECGWTPTAALDACLAGSAAAP